MPTLKIKATKMKDATVSFVSLVERGANRIPFKIMKQENHMAKSFPGIDLGALFARKAEKPVVGVTGVITMKGDDFESIKKQVFEAGFAVDAMVEDADGSVIFKQEGWEEGGTVVRLSDHVAIVTKGFSPYNMDMSMNGEVSFADMCNAQGFYPGIRTIMEVMTEAVGNAARNAASPAEAKSAVSKMFDEAKTYTVSFMSALPEKAFKLEALVPEVSVDKAAKKVVCKSCGTEVAAGEKKCPSCGADPMAEPTKKEEGEGEVAADTAVAEPAVDAPVGEAPVAGAETEPTPTTKSEVETGDETPVQPLTEDQVSSIVLSQVAKSTEELTQKMEAMMSSLSESLKTTMSSIEGGVTALQGRMEQAEQVAKSASEAVQGVVVGGTPHGDHSTVTKKSETGHSGREIDTGWMPRHRR